MFLKDRDDLDSKDTLHRILDEAFLIAQISLEGKFIDANERFLELFQYSLEEIYMADCQLLLNGYLYDIQGVAKPIHQGKKWSGESCFMTKYGELKWLESTFVPIAGEGGEIEKILSFHIDRTASKHALRWKDLAMRNELTNLPNRRKLMQMLELLAGEAEWKGTSFAVLFMDINCFKDVNDNFGHHIGDLLLMEVGKRLSSLPLCRDSVYHISGDEFIILLEDTSQIESAVKSIVSSFYEEFIVESICLNVQVSIGISMFPDHGTNLEHLVRRADEAMYEAKSTHTGHDRSREESYVKFYGTGIEQERM